MLPPPGQHADIVDLIDICKTEIRRLNLDWAVRPGTIGVRTMELKTRFPEEFRDQQIISHPFPELTLTVEQVLSVV